MINEAQRIIASKFLLLVRWTSVDAHEIGFRQSEEYQQWKLLLHRFYDPFPVVLHYAFVGADAAQ